jgi:ketosteroid isomerase-like protein
VDRETKPDATKNQADAHTDAQSDQSVDEFFTRLQSDMRRPDLSQDAISAAFQAIQKLAIDPETEEPANTTARHTGTAGGHICPACNAENSERASYCATCGVPLQQPSEGGVAHAAQPGQHHYHHHYHHYLPAANGVSQGSTADFRPSASVPGPTRDPKSRPPAGAAPLSRAEAGARKVTQDWTLACNTKHLDDLVELYATDALVLRPNFPTVRGTAAIREFFFAALDAGLGEAQLEPIRVELFGDVAYEAGRCKTLVPGAMGKRREERGKYMVLLTRQPASDWKIIADCWSSDLSLSVTPEAASPAAASPRPLRK